MKFLILILSLTLIPTISRAQLTNVISRSYVGTTEYQFALSKSELANASDWDPTEGVPRLSPGKASSLAKDYLDRITKGKTSVGGKRIAWQLNSITLQKASIDPERCLCLRLMGWTSRKFRRDRLPVWKYHRSGGE
jgi:hypothetical protein